MKTVEFVSSLRRQGISLWVEGNTLRYTAPKGMITSTLKAELAQRKNEVLEFLRQSHPDISNLTLAPKTVQAELTARPAFTPPRSPTEELLANIWAQVLGAERVGIHDNFFDLGGDSLLILEVIAKGSQAGLRFTPRQLMLHQTIAELAELEHPATALAEAELVTGPVPLLMDQFIFLLYPSQGHILNPHHRNIALLLEIHERLNPGLLEQAVRQIVAHHAALSTRFVFEGASWQASIAFPDEAIRLICIDLSELPTTEQAVAIEMAAGNLQASLNLSNGPLLRVTLFILEADEPNRLLIIAHHNVVDAFSREILKEDLLEVYGQLRRGEPPRLPPQTTSVKRLAEYLDHHMRSVTYQELDYWRSLDWKLTTYLPVDYPIQKDNAQEISCQTLRKSLPTEETKILLGALSKATPLFDVLLTALVQTISGWSGKEWVTVFLVESGRNISLPESENLDLSRTVGNLTTQSLLCLKAERPESPINPLLSIQEQLRRIPNRGRGYYWLRHLGKETGQELVPKVFPELVFNYLGWLKGGSTELGPVRRARESNGFGVPLETPVWCLIDCRAALIDESLNLTWRYSQDVHKATTIEGLANDFLKRLQDLSVYSRVSTKSIAQS